MADRYQIVGFHFRVVFYGLSSQNEVDMGFQSVSGLDVEMKTETYNEGGENRFSHRLPGRIKYSTLVLRRGIHSPEDSALTQWLQDAFQNQHIVPLKNVQVDLLNENHEVLMRWDLYHVWPISWEVGELNAEKGEVLIETLELNYNYSELRAPKNLQNTSR
jgi:phage tail-like protein